MATKAKRCGHSVKLRIHLPLKSIIILLVFFRLLSRSIYLMNTLEEETGLDPGFINNGGVFIAHNEVI